VFNFIFKLHNFHCFHPFYTFPVSTKPICEDDHDWLFVYILANGATSFIQPLTYSTRSSKQQNSGRDALPQILSGANSGKKRKIANLSEEEKKLKQQKYEEHRPERKFSDKWLVGRPWLMYDKSAMFCNWCIDYNNKLTYVNNHYKKNMNTFYKNQR